MTLHVYIDYQRANLAKLGTSSLWRYWRSFKLVGLPYLSQFMLSFRILAFYLLNTDFHLQGSPNPNLTKAQLVDAVQQHFASQVSLLPHIPRTQFPYPCPMHFRLFDHIIILRDEKILTWLTPKMHQLPKNWIPLFQAHMHTVQDSETDFCLLISVLLAANWRIPSDFGIYSCSKETEIGWNVQRMTGKSDV